MKKVELNKNWKFKIDQSGSLPKEILNPDHWLNATLPGTVHTDLLNLGLIENPFYENNELKLQWISNCDWTYKTSFDYPNEFENEFPVIIVFEGLDTVAEALLNKEPIGNFNNMFRMYEIDITSKLLEKDNELVVKFTSPIKYAKTQEKRYGKLYVEVNSERVYTRKAQYSYGWDWGPSFPTIGVYKPVYLLQKNIASIKSLKFHTVEISQSKAIVEIDVELESNIDPNFLLEVSLSLKDRMIDEKVVTKVSTTNNIRMEIDNPALWWPCCLGNQPLYNLTAILKDNNEEIIDLNKRTVGIRTVELLLKKDGENTFKFLINNKEIFIKGANWIPTDSFLPRTSKDKYNKLLLLAKRANCNMIRVWGGGIYEQDIFYALCDELGLLVWQDFMFACGSYPEHEEFIENVKIEVIQNVERLQHHPSIALWCGNNECEWLWYQNKDEDKNISKLPGYNIYHQLIPGLLKDVDPLRPYWPSSPFGYDEDPNDQNSGNTHQWNIWSNWIDYTEVTKDDSLFVSEFGFQAPANISTWRSTLSKDNLHCQNQIFESHNKQTEGQERLFKFLSGHLPVSNEWSDFIYLTQLNQALALKTCIEHWRINGMTNGCLIWQLNDCWPATSWSLIDNKLTPKMSYYFVKNAYSTQLVFIKKENFILNFYLLNQTGDELKGYININFIDPSSGKTFQEVKKNILVEAHNLKIVDTVSVSELPENNEWLIIVSLYNEKRLVHRNYYLEKEWKHIQLSETKVDLDVVVEDESAQVVLESLKPVFFIDLYHPEFNFSDRGFFILPGEKITLDIIGEITKPFKKEDINIYSLNNYLKN